MYGVRARMNQMLISFLRLGGDRGKDPHSNTFPDFQRHLLADCAHQIC